MSNVKVVLNIDGFNQLRKCPEMQSFVTSKAEEIASRCGSGYSSDVKQMGTRVIASVYSETSEAERDNLENNTILKNMR